MDQESAPLRFEWVRSLAGGLASGKAIRPMTVIRKANTRRASVASRYSAS